VSNGAAAGLLAPALSPTLPGLATGMVVLNLIGLCGWLAYRRIAGTAAAQAP